MVYILNIFYLSIGSLYILSVYIHMVTVARFLLSIMLYH